MSIKIVFRFNKIKLFSLFNVITSNFLQKYHLKLILTKFKILAITNTNFEINHYSTISLSKIDIEEVEYNFIVLKEFIN